MGYRLREKPDYKVILETVEEGARVLDLGCGDGTLLSMLIEKKKVQGVGVDIYPDGLNECLTKGLSVIELDLNEGLKSFADNSFDYVVLNMTLQAIYHPLNLIQEMVRVGKKAIVGFPNFSYLKLILRFLLSQRMPKSKTLPYEWYNTPNIRLLTIKDFYALCDNNNIKISKKFFLSEEGKKLSGPFLNFRTAEGLFVIEQKSLEDKHSLGYLKKPVTKGEFDDERD